MALEIERKFLVVDESWKNSVVSSAHIRDGLVASNNDRKVRIRISDSVATIALKGPHVGIARAEFEYFIPLSDAEKIMQTMCDIHLLEKRRHLVPYQGVNWLIDVYEGLLKGVVLADVEMKTIDQSLTIPPWIGQEVTGDPEFRKAKDMFSETDGTREIGLSLRCHIPK